MLKMQKAKYKEKMKECGISHTTIEIEEKLKNITKKNV